MTGARTIMNKFLSMFAVLLVSCQVQLNDTNEKPNNPRDPQISTATPNAVTTLAEHEQERIAPTKTSVLNRAIAAEVAGTLATQDLDCGALTCKVWLQLDRASMGWVYHGIESKCVPIVCSIIEIENQLYKHH